VKGSERHRPVLQEKAFVDVYSLLVVGAHVVDGRQAQLVLRHVLQILMETHQTLLIVKLKHNIKTMKGYINQKCYHDKAAKTAKRNEGMNHTKEQKGHRNLK